MRRGWDLSLEEEGWGRAPLGDGALCDGHDPFKLQLLVRKHEGDSGSPFACPGCSPYPVEVHMGVIGDIIVDDVWYVIDVKPPCGNLGGYEELELALPEPVEN